MLDGNAKRVPENINFPEEEEKIQEYWKKENAFENCLKQSKGKPRYSLFVVNLLFGFFFLDVDNIADAIM